MEDFLSAIRERVLISDGAMGSQLQERGFGDICPYLLNSEKPEVVLGIQKDYVSSGSDLLITNTFGANRSILERHKLEERAKEFNENAVKVSRQAFADKGLKGFVAAEMGPLAEYLEPTGKISFDQAHEIYCEQAEGQKAADVIAVSTMSDTKMLKAAIIAAKDSCNLPIWAQMTFEDGVRGILGTDIRTFVEICHALDVDVIGTNCGAGPKEAYEGVKLLVKYTDKPLSIKPNAGVPKIVNGKAVIDVSPEPMAEYAKKFVELGANMVGSCCSSSPAHVKAIAEAVKGTSVKKRAIGRKTTFCSRTRTVEVDDSPLIIGERINPTKKKVLADEIKVGKTALIRSEAMKQVAEGAQMLDINVGVLGVDAAESMPRAVRAVQSVVDAPLVIDSSDPKAIEAALKESDGKPLINSVNGEERNLSTILPLAKRYGAAIIALCVDGGGVPKTAEQRVEIARKITNAALMVRIHKEDIVVDCVVVPAALGPENEEIVIDALGGVNKIGYNTLLGISNISHGLPERSKINAGFFEKSKAAGLNMGIMNPHDVGAEAGDIKEFTVKKTIDYEKLSLNDQLYNAVLYGDEENIADVVERALKEIEPMKINSILVKALNEVGDKFDKKEYYLPQVLASAGAMKAAFGRLKHEIAKAGGKPRGTILFATVVHDIHDIGKNIVIALLESYGFTVIDLGHDVPAEKIVEAAKRENPDIIGLSALMTTTAIEMENVIKELRKNSINTPVMIGGAVITDEFAKQIGGCYSPDATSAVKEVERILNELPGQDWKSIHSNG